MGIEVLTDEEYSRKYGPYGARILPAVVESTPSPEPSDPFGGITNADNPVKPIEFSMPEQTNPPLSDFDTANALAITYNVLGKKDPDAEARDREAAYILDLPQWAISASPETRKAALETAKLQRNSPADWEDFVQRYPKTSEYLSNGSNMITSQDDIKNLGKTEDIIGSFTLATKISTLQTEKSEIEYTMWLAGPGASLTGEKWEALHQRKAALDLEIKALTKQAGDKGWSAESTAFNTGSFLPSMWFSTKKAGERAIQGGAMGALTAAAFSLMGPQLAVSPALVLAGTVTGLGVGGKVGYAEGTFIQEIGIYNDLLELTDAKGNKVDPKTAWAYAGLAAGAKAGLEMASLTQAMKVVPGGDKLIRLIDSKGGQKYLDTLNKSNGSVIRGMIIALARASIAETTTEVGQTAVDIVAKNAAIDSNPKMDPRLKTPLGTLTELWKGFINGEDPTDPNPSAMSQTGNVARATIQGSVGLALPGTIVNTHRGLKAVRNFDAQVERDQQTFAKIEELFKDSPTLKRSTEATSEFLGHNVDGTELQSLYVDAKAFTELFQDKAPEVAKELGIDPAHLSETAALGGKIEIATKDAIPRLIKSGTFGALTKDMSFSATGETYNERQERNKTDEAAMQREIDKAQPAVDEAVKNNAATKAVFDTVYSAEKAKFVDAGYGEKEAHANATILAQSVVVKTVGEKIDWKQAWNTFAYDIQTHKVDDSGNQVKDRLIPSPGRIAPIQTPAPIISEEPTGNVETNPTTTPAEVPVTTVKDVLGKKVAIDPAHKAAWIANYTKANGSMMSQQEIDNLLRDKDAPTRTAEQVYDEDIAPGLNKSASPEPGVLPQGSPYELNQLKHVEHVVTVRDNAPQQVRVYEVSTYPDEIAKLFGKDAPAEIEFKTLEEARTINASPERIADWQQIYAKSESLTDFASMRKVNKDGKLETVPVIALTKGCQRAQVSVERVNNGILPNETRVEACYGGTCWVNRQFNSMFGAFENMEVRDLAMTTPDVIKKIFGRAGSKLTDLVKFLSEGPFIREGQMGCSSHSFPILERYGVSLAETWLKGINDAGIKSKTVFITAAYAPVSKESYARLVPYKDLMEIHVSVSGWFHKNELMIRLAEFQAIRDAGLPVALRLVTNKDNVAGLDMVNHEWLLEKMKEMNVQQNEVLETPYHDDAIKKKDQQKRSDPTGEFKYICCETGKCLSCPAKCMTTDKTGSVATSFSVKDLGANETVGEKSIPIELNKKDKTAGNDPAVVSAPVLNAEVETSQRPIPSLTTDASQLNDTTSAKKIKRVNVILNQEAVPLNQSPVNLYQSSGPVTPEENIRRGTEAMQSVIDTQSNTLDAMHRPETGPIEFIWGEEGTEEKSFEDGFGVAKIIKKHGVSVAKRIPEVIAKGKAELSKSGDRVYFAYNDMLAVVRLTWDGNARVWLLTGFEKGQNKKPPMIPEDVGPSGTTPNERSFAGVAEASIESIAQKNINKKMYQDARASVNLSTKVINYFNTDESSFIHEFGHIRLHDLFDTKHEDSVALSNWFVENIPFVRNKLSDEMNHPKTTPERKAQIESVLALDDSQFAAMAKEMNPTDDAGKVIYTEFHEMWARGWERYLMEGKAPSAALNRVFRSFVKWLTKIYKTVDQLNAPISPEVRAVMDRLLATETEIAEKMASLELANSMIEESNLPPGSIADILELQEKVRGRAEDILRRSKMSDIRKEQKDKEAAEIERITPEIRLDVDKMPVWDRIDAIKGAFSGKLQSIAKMYQDGTLEAQSRGVWDVIADAYQMSGIEMAEEVTTHPTFDQVVEQRVKEHIQAMRDAMPKVNPLDAVHNENSLELLALQKELMADLIIEQQYEKQHAAMGENQNVVADANQAEDARQADEYGKQAVADARKAETRLKRDLDQIRRDAANRAAISAKDIARQAEAIIAARPIGKIQPAPYFTQEAAAAKASERAMLAKDYQKAVEYKNQQMLNHALGLAALRAKREIDKRTKQIKWIEKSKAKMAVDDRYQLDRLLQRFGLTNKAPVPSNIEDAQTASLGEWIQNKYDIFGQDYANLDAVELFINETEAANVTTLSMERFRELHDAIKNIYTFSRELQVIEINGQKVEVDVHVNNILQTAYTRLTPAHPEKNNPELSKLEKVQKIKDSINSELLTMDTICTVLDGQNDKMGPAYSLFRLMPNLAWNDKAKRMRDVMNNIKALLDDYGSAKGLRDKNYYIPEAMRPGEKKYSYSKENLLTVALNLGNDGNRQRVMDGFGWDAATLDIVTSKLTEKDWDLVQGIWDFVATFKQEIMENHEKATGVVLKMVEVVPFDVTLPDGTTKHLEGGYWPAKYNRDRAVSIETKQKADEMKGEIGGVRAVTSQSHTKARAAKVTAPIDLNGLTVLATHMEQVLQDLHFRKPVMDMNKVLYNKDFQRGISKILGKQYWDAMDQYVKTQAKGERGNGGGATVGLGDMVRGGLALSIMSFKASVAIPQVAGALQFAQNMGPLAVVKALSKFYHNPFTVGNGQIKSSWALKIRDVINRSEYMKERTTLWDRDVHDMVDTGLDIGDKALPIRAMAAMNRVGMWIHGFTDGMATFPCWIEHHETALLKYGGDEKRAVEEADHMVRISVGSSRRGDRAQIQNRDGASKWFTMFYSFGNALYNMEYRAHGMAKNDGKFGPVLGIVFGQMILGQIINEVLAGRGADLWDDDDEKRNKFLAKTILGSAVAPIPVLRDINSFLISDWLGEYSSYRATPLEAIVKQVAAVGKDSYKWWNDEGDGDEAVKEIAKLLGYAPVIGFPQQFVTTGWNLYDHLIRGSDFEWADLLYPKSKERR